MEHIVTDVNFWLIGATSRPIHDNLDSELLSLSIHKLRATGLFIYVDVSWIFRYMNYSLKYRQIVIN